MLRMAKTCLLAFVVVLLALGTVLAVPPQPFSPYGIVTLNGENVAEDTEVTAWCGGVQYGPVASTMYEGASWYPSLDVPGDDLSTPEIEGCTSGEAVSFEVDGFPADQTAEWAPVSIQLDLTARTCRAGDFDGDCDIDILDVMQVANRWGCGAACYDEAYDPDGDGVIDVADIMSVAACWGCGCGNERW